MTYNFDLSPDRRHTASLKWDAAPSEDVIPLWVADMDFRTAPEIVAALKRRAEHGVFGYVRVPQAYYEALTSWFDRRHGWRFDARRVIYTTGVVPAVSAILKALTRPGQGVIVQTPAYNCFFSSLRNNGCRTVENPLRRVDDATGFHYEFDFEDLEAKAAEADNVLLLLCNPHNPTGRVWTRAELERVHDICQRHGVTVLSDEIHCELTLPGLAYTPYALIDPTCITCCSPSKAFNIAGLQVANIVCPDAQTQRRIDRAINDNEVCDVNPFGVDALIAAYTEGEAWLDALRAYIADNYQYLCRFVSEQWPGLAVCRLEGTYLAWVDVRAVGLPSEELAHRLLHEAKVWVNAGTMYHEEGYLRLNLACPRTQLTEGLKRMAGWIESYRKS
jgi:cystathionine beta-lyase